MVWSLVIDSLLVELDREGFEVVGYADDIAILVRGKFDSVISDRMQTALNVVWNWCLRNGLGVNPSKTVLIPCTKKRSLRITRPLLGNQLLEFQDQVKCLGVILDSKLTFSSHVQKVIAKATNSFMACKSIMCRK